VVGLDPVDCFHRRIRSFEDALQNKAQCALEAFNRKDCFTAETKYSNAVQLSRDLHGESDIITLRLILNLADSYAESGQIDDPSDWYTVVRERARRKPVKYDEDMAAVLKRALVGQQENGRKWYEKGGYEMCFHKIASSFAQLI
jgi:hypothetical protein